MILKPWFDVVLKVYASRFKACCSENPTAYTVGLVLNYSKEPAA